MGFNFYKNKTRYLHSVADDFSPTDEWMSEKHAIKRINSWIKSVKQSIPCHLELPKNLATINVYIESRFRHTMFLSFERRVFINHKNCTVYFPTRFYRMEMTSDKNHRSDFFWKIVLQNFKGFPRKHKWCSPF